MAGGSLLAIVVVSLLAIVSVAQAAFPGRNGKIAFLRAADPVNTDIYAMNADGSDVTPIKNDALFDYSVQWSPDGAKLAVASGSYTLDSEIYTMNADGSGITALTDNSADDTDAGWSPDGGRLAFISSRDGNYEVYEMNADGTGVTRLTNTPERELGPEWSPDGTKIAFTRIVDGDYEIFSMNADGSGAINLTHNSGFDDDPNWSPDGTKIAFSSGRIAGGHDDIYTMNPDGSGVTRITTDAAFEREPAWSPDGTKIAFTSTPASGATDWNIFSMDADGAGRTQLTNTTSFGSYQPDWQPLHIPVRPRGATPLRASLVPAYTACTSPNRSHGAPLAYGSCTPPVRASSQLTVGTPDANGQADQSTGSVTLKTILGNESTPADEADLRIDTTITDVRRVTGLADYNGELSTVLQVRLTDQLSDAQTVQALPFRVTVPCTVTADTTVGSTCALVTTADTVMPGAVPESSRAIWALDKVEVYDGGPDGLASTTAGNTLFETQGVFVP